MKAFVAGVVLVVVVSGCGSEPPKTGRPESSATIEIVAPADGAEITGPSFVVQVELSGGRIVEETSLDLTPDEGHVHISIDGEVLTLNSGLTDTIDSPEAGQHLLQVEFVAKDHAPFAKRIFDTAAFEVI